MKSRNLRSVRFLVLAGCLATTFALGCAPAPIGGEDAGTPTIDAARIDAAPMEAGQDVRAVDRAYADLTAVDSLPADAGTDARMHDRGSGDQAAYDAPLGDAAAVDTGPHDSASEDVAPVPVHCVTPVGADSSGTATLMDSLGLATVAITDRGACARSYTLTTTAVRRDNLPPSPRGVVERTGAPTLRSGHDLFDALYALALDEVRESSVDEISDPSFAGGSGVPCGVEGSGCFETGRLWRYVWTRDTAYAADLALASIDPDRSRGSLEFKLSERRGGGDLQIVQDTGSGGGYPVSSDRVVWALGAWATLLHLDAPSRTAFGDRAYQALTHTIEHDRRVVRDPVDGLYRGEQSFLDWRAQSYAAETADNVVPIAEGKALSTNLLHLRATEITSMLAAERGDEVAQQRYSDWADSLRTSIAQRFWLEDTGLFSTLIPGGLDAAPVHRYDLLGSALAVLTGVATPAQTTRILASYPHYGPGAPVIWPQQQRTPIYHNRGEWPFVSAYWLRAAARAGNDAVAERMVRTLMRGAALNLSNMENFEAATGAPFLAEGTTSGPVVNSQRQLWSVAGYLSMVQHTLFGLHAEADGMHMRPFVTAGLRETLFAGSDALVLNDYPWQSGTITVVLHLPAQPGIGALVVQDLLLNGASLSDDLLPAADLSGEDRVDVFLTTATGAGATLHQRSDADWREVFGPTTPAIAMLQASTSDVTLHLDAGGEAASQVLFHIYRDGLSVASGLPGSITLWTDSGVDPDAERSPCWAVETAFVTSGNRSQRSPAQCWWGSGYSHITTVDASALVAVGGAASTNHGRFHYENWGDPGHSLTAPSFTPIHSGPHMLQLVYGNGAGPLETGITCAVKRIVVEELAGGAEAGAGVVVMPQLGSWERWEDSSLLAVQLQAGTSYRVVIAGGDEAINMSSFAHFATYNGGLGGIDGEYHRVNIAELKILAH